MAESKPYLMPRQVETRTEIAPGIGPAEAGLLLVAGGLGFGCQWIVSLVHLAGMAGHVLLVVRGLAAIIPPGLAWLSVRPTQSGRALDYGLAILRYYRTQGGRPRPY